MEKTGKIIIVFFVIVLFAALVLLSAVDLSKYIDRPEADTQGMVSSVGGQETEDKLSQEALSNLTLGEGMGEEKGGLHSSHKFLGEDKENIQIERKVEEKADAASLSPKGSGEVLINKASEVSSEGKADTKMSPKPDIIGDPKIEKKIVRKTEQKAAPATDKGVESYPYSVSVSFFL